MDPIIKIVLDMSIEDDMEEWLSKTSNGEEVHTDEVYLAHTVNVDGYGKGTDEEFRIIIPSRLVTPHNKFFVDVIHKEGLGILNGYTGFGMTPNTGRCVVAIEPLSDKFGKEIASLEEIKTFVDEQNKEIKGKKLL